LLTLFAFFVQNIWEYKGTSEIVGTWTSTVQFLVIFLKKVGFKTRNADSTFVIKRKIVKYKSLENLCSREKIISYFFFQALL